MVWLDDKDIWFGFPEFFDGFVGRPEPQGLELLGEFVGDEPVLHMPAHLIDRGVVEGLDGRFLDGSHHAFGLAVGPWMVWLGQPMLDAVFLADAFEDMDQPPRLAAARVLDELDTVVGQHRVDPIGHGFDQYLQKGSRRQLGGAAIDTGEDQLRGAVDRDIEETLAAFVTQLGDIDVEVANLVGLELLRLLPVSLGQARDAVALQAAMQRRARQVRDHIRDCQEFRVWLGIMGEKETHYVETVFSLMPNRFARLATEASDRCSSPRTACVVLTLPCKTWPIIPPAAMAIILHHHTLGLNT